METNDFLESVDHSYLCKHYKQNEVNWKPFSFKARAKYFSNLGANAEVHFDKSLKPRIS